MPPRSITDKEIALIKAMLARKMKNRDIQFYFNRQDRPVNSGRITQIRDNTYGPHVTAATEADLNNFLSTFKSAEIGAVVVDRSSSAPTKAEIVKALFRKGDDGHWRVDGGETDQHECKRDFDPKRLSPVLCAIAALSNNRGGFLFLGVSNAECKAEGVCDDFERFDIAKLMDKAKTHLSPTPRVTMKDVVVLDTIKVGFIHVDAHPDKPVIVCKDDGDKLKEGEILFRYAGQSARIKFGDLRDLLAERDRRAQMALATAAGKLAAVGTAKALIIDTDKNVLDADGREILIDEQLVKTINFIREGEFDEIEGSPTLKLIGEVKSVHVDTLKAERLVPKAITQDDILSSFLTQEAVSNPKEYVFAAVSQPRLWFPIFFLVKAGNLDITTLIKEVGTLTTSQKGKKQNLIDRLAGKKTAYTATSTLKAKALGADIAGGKINVPKSAPDVTIFAHAFCSVKTTKAPLADCLKALEQCRSLAISADDMNALGAVFKAACRIDEIFFKDS